MSKKTGWGAFALGALVGGTLGILFAPKPGKETRKELKEKIDDLVEKAKDIDVTEVKDKIVAKTQEIIDDLKDLDKEKVKDIAYRKIALLKVKCEELVDLAKEKTTPVIEKASKEVKNKTLAVLKDVEKNSGADKAGLPLNSIITKIEGRSVDTTEELVEELQYYRKGETVKVTYYVQKDGKYVEKSLDIKLQ